jgi:uncharacterized Rmd1/YagE family protein
MMARHKTSLDDTISIKVEHFNQETKNEWKWFVIFLRVIFYKLILQLPTEILIKYCNFPKYTNFPIHICL